MSETQSATIKPRFELILGAVLLVIVLALALRPVESQQAEPISTPPAENQVVSGEIPERQPLSERRPPSSDANLGGVDTPDEITNSTDIKLVHAFPLKEALFSDLLKAESTDVENMDTSEDYLENNQYWKMILDEVQPLELMQTIKFEDIIQGGTFLCGTVNGKFQPDQGITINGVIRVWKGQRVYLTLSMTVAPSTEDAAQNSAGSAAFSPPGR